LSDDKGRLVSNPEILFFWEPDFAGFAGNSRMSDLLELEPMLKRGTSTLIT